MSPQQIQGCRGKHLLVHQPPAECKQASFGIYTIRPGKSDTDRSHRFFFGSPRRTGNTTGGKCVSSAGGVSCAGSHSFDSLFVNRAMDFNNFSRYFQNTCFGLVRIGDTRKKEIVGTARDIGQPMRNQSAASRRRLTTDATGSVLSPFFWGTSGIATRRLRDSRRSPMARFRACANLTVEPLEPRQLLTGDLVISEFMARNDGGLRDGDGRASDWIEIFNGGQDTIDLAGYRLTDDAENLRTMADFLAEYDPAPPLFLLPYHALAQDKYARLGRLSDRPEIPALTDADAAACAEPFLARGLTVQVGG